MKQRSRHGLLKENEQKLSRAFNFTFRYIEDVCSLNNSKKDDFVPAFLQHLDVEILTVF
jgi:hypothetical protein